MTGKGVDAAKRSQTCGTWTFSHFNAPAFKADTLFQ